MSSINYLPNRTPHPLTILPSDAPASALDKAIMLPAGDRGDLARVRTSPHVVGDLAGVDVLSPGWGSIAGLADPQPGVVQIVSVVVVQAAIATGRTVADLAVPGEQVRDDKGRIVAARGLYRGADAFPRANWQRLPRVAVFGSAARWVLADRDRRVAQYTGAPMPDLPPAPRDIDVAYVGMDPDAAREVVGDWLHGYGSFLRERFPALPLDLHCMASIGRDDLALPRPGRLGAGDDLALDEAVCPLWGGDDVRFVDLHTLPAQLRRAGVLLSAGRDVAEVADMFAAGFQGADILIGDGEERHRDTYASSSTAAIRRALDKLGEHVEPLAAALRERGLPILTILRVARRPVLPVALDRLERGHRLGEPVLRIGRDGDRWYIGPIHGSGPYWNDDLAAAHWLTGD